MRKIVFGIILILSITLISCGNIKIASKTNLSEKNGVDFSFRVSYDQNVGKDIKNDFMEGQLELNNIVVNKYVEGANTIEEINVKDKSLSNLASNENIKKILNYRVSKKDYFYKSVYIVEIRPGTAIFNIEKKYEEEKSKEAIRNIPFTNIVSFDGELITTNAKEIVSPNEVRWNTKIGLLNNNTVMTLQYKVNTWWKIGVLLGGIVVIGIIIYLLMLLKRNKKKSKIEKTDGY
ncbi:MAG: hypothetical protein ACRC28_15705 [Clostridium sp.]|uniref:hypothetical protein n=1 Tax=Clostridium sp. TaxID=1506 RepID=UPI003F3A09C5